MSDAELIEAETKRSGRFHASRGPAESSEEGRTFQRVCPRVAGGDFNCPSHLDWTKDTQRVFASGGERWICP